MSQLLSGERLARDPLILEMDGARAEHNPQLSLLAGLPKRFAYAVQLFVGPFRTSNREGQQMQKFTWNLPGYEGSYDADVEAVLEDGQVTFVLYTYNPNYGGAAGMGTLPFEELLRSGPPRPLSREMCGDLFAEVRRRLALSGQ